MICVHNYHFGMFKISFNGGIYQTEIVRRIEKNVLN
jgi:hypothetical protein